jgi:hypothetical protein
MDLENLKNNPEQLRNLIEILSSLLPDSEDNDPKHPAKPKNNIKTNKSKAKGSSVNLFDKMSERNLHKEDVEIDRILSKTPPTERNRQFSHVELVCRCCGKKEKCNPALVIDKTRYKCNKCSASAG